MSWRGLAVPAPSWRASASLALIRTSAVSKSAGLGEQVGREHFGVTPTQSVGNEHQKGKGLNNMTALRFSYQPSTSPSSYCCWCGQLWATAQRAAGAVARGAAGDGFESKSPSMTTVVNGAR